MIYVKKLVKSIKMKVKLPMIVECNNKGDVNLVNGWSVSVHIKHINIRLIFLQDLKEAGIICVKWVLKENTVADLHKKNLNTSAFKKHARKHCGNDEY